MCRAGSSPGDERSACRAARLRLRRLGTPQGGHCRWADLDPPAHPARRVPPAPHCRQRQRLVHRTHGCHSSPSPTSKARDLLSRTNSAQAATAAAQGAKETREAPGHAGKSNRDFACSVARYSYGSGGCSSACDTSPARRRRRISHGRRSVRLRGTASGSTLSRPKSIPAGDRQPTHLSFPSQQT